MIAADQSPISTASRSFSNDSSWIACQINIPRGVRGLISKTVLPSRPSFPDRESNLAPPTFALPSNFRCPRYRDTARQKRNTREGIDHGQLGTLLLVLVSVRLPRMEARQKGSSMRARVHMQPSRSRGNARGIIQCLPLFFFSPPPSA